MPAIYQKYRPKTFADVTGQEHIKLTLQNQIAAGRPAHAYIFSGPRGVGKTTLARLFAKAANCTGRKEGDNEPCNTCSNCEEINAGRALDMIEIDAASNTQVDKMRENVIDTVRFAPNKSRYKVYLIDEAHMLTTHSFNALLKTLEEPPVHVIFILATTEIHKIPETILSRCQRFDFGRIAPDQMTERLARIAKEEEVKMDDAVIASVVRLSQGFLRDAESLFGQLLVLGEKNITQKEAELVLPKTYDKTSLDLMFAISHKDIKTVLEVLHDFTDRGGNVKHLQRDLIQFVRTMIFFAIGGDIDHPYDEKTVEAMREMSERLHAQDLVKLLDALLSASARGGYDPLPQLPLEIALVRFFEGAGGSVEVVQNSVEKKVETDEKNVKKDEKENPSPSEINISLQEIQDKWGRCCQALSKRNIALPLLVQEAKAVALAGNELTLGFPLRFHFETMDEQKNIALLEDAIFETLQVKLHVKPVFLGESAEKEIADIAQAFGGTVID